jgi:hypothetical protein
MSNEKGKKSELTKYLKKRKMKNLKSSFFLKTLPQSEYLLAYTQSTTPSTSLNISTTQST